ncbi:hypothetical protein ATANTOWER_031980 [Ataeniobius toweri]|uniref:Uncharacterized protein n=1 Tax=Ataeniobius toweri TaxID=208326 RepID=A0ABU7BDF3_9TELE|nr:hypothetical protein [Ataeniobius toweri]
MSWGSSFVWCWRLQSLTGLSKAGHLGERQLADYSPTGHSLTGGGIYRLSLAQSPFSFSPSLHDFSSKETPEACISSHYSTATGYMFDKV